MNPVCCAELCCISTIIKSICVHPPFPLSLPNGLAVIGAHGCYVTHCFHHGNQSPPWPPCWRQHITGKKQKKKEKNLYGMVQQATNGPEHTAARLEWRTKRTICAAVLFACIYLVLCESTEELAGNREWITGSGVNSYLMGALQSKSQQEHYQTKPESWNKTCITSTATIVLQPSQENKKVGAY